MESVVKMGPCGGAGGASRDMDMRGVERVIKVAVRYGSTVDAVSVLYERHGHKEWTDLWGGRGGDLNEINLQPDEYFTSVSGFYGKHKDDLAVRSLTFVSNRRTFGPYGRQEGIPFQLPAGGGKIIGFHGRSGSHLVAFGTYVKIAHQQHYLE